MDNPYAFPAHGSMGEVAHEGMSLRDYFAAKALPSMLALAHGQPDLNIIPDHSIAVRAYAMADAMLKVRG